MYDETRVQQKSTPHRFWFLLRLTVYVVLLSVVGVLGQKSAYALTPLEQKMIERATPYFSLVNELTDEYWPALTMRSYIPAQIEKESLWNPRAQLCVPKPSCSRELGVGFGQFTVTPRMNVWLEVKNKYAPLRDWKWEDRFDPRYQVTAMLLYNKEIYTRCRPLMSNEWGALACTASSYNGGFGGFQADRRLCGNTAGCDPTRWTNHIELTSTKSKVRVPGYGEPFYYINRGYVKKVMTEFSPKYTPYVGSGPSGVTK